jgi:hypothetical protein
MGDFQAEPSQSTPWSTPKSTTPNVVMDAREYTRQARIKPRKRSRAISPRFDKVISQTIIQNPYEMNKRSIEFSESTEQIQDMSEGFERYSSCFYL